MGDRFHVTLRTFSRIQAYSHRRFCIKQCIRSNCQYAVRVITLFTPKVSTNQYRVFVFITCSEQLILNT